MYEIDEFDRKILNLLQGNSRLTGEDLSERVGLSPSACQRRLKKLRESGVIANEVAILAPKAIGNHMTLIVQIILKTGGADILDAFKREMMNLDQVQQCYYVTGDYDFVMVVSAKDINDYERFTHRAYFENPYIEKFNTMVVMDSIKLGLQVPL